MADDFKVDVQYYGDKETRDLIDLFEKDVSSEIAKALSLAAVKIANEAKNLAPKDTQNLAANIAIEEVNKDKKDHDLKVGVTKNIKYAKWVEYGMKNPKKHLAYVGSWGKRHGFDSEFIYVSGKAHPFLRPAFNKNKKFVEKYVVQYYKNAVKAAGKRVQKLSNSILSKIGKII